MCQSSLTLSFIRASHFVFVLCRLDLKEAVHFFEQTKHDRNEGACEKLDDRMQPIPQDIHGAVVRTDKDTLNAYQSEGKQRTQRSHEGKDRAHVVQSNDGLIFMIYLSTMQIVCKLFTFTIFSCCSALLFQD